ncbi:hypothetical protein [Sinomicrobium soli]|uniref:hypothetical protein n=1 Tax=Sinomicrobium sp. N-1-3-6 TaxID=2219864 RepID=UPI000DCB9627|nr:hypothetical protein [Sinomicrobium sp. N-1-3-6]RAV28476.1 hypothetical protein DN748_12710 [Sinomicrobium sp. N-1-3-6]
MKKILLILIFFVLGLIIINHKKVGNIFFKEKVYILFDRERDVFKKPDWSKYIGLFPPDFDPEKASDIEQLAKLNEKQRKQYDNIRKILYKYPRKVISFTNENRKYVIMLSSKEAIEYTIISTKPVDYEESKSFDVIPVDSVVNITPGVRFAHSEEKNNNLLFNIIEIDSINKKAFISQVKPIIVEYD